MTKTQRLLADLVDAMLDARDIFELQAQRLWGNRNPEADDGPEVWERYMGGPWRLVNLLDDELKAIAEELDDAGFRDPKETRDRIRQRITNIQTQLKQGGW